MAERSPTIPPFPLPTDEQARALQIAVAYLSLVGRQTAICLLGCPAASWRNDAVGQYREPPAHRGGAVRGPGCAYQPPGRDIGNVNGFA
jgi:hypothetical protein